ncbi:MAG: VCBS domain-containing protein, partial [Candidatus Saccharibacteria bacterium]
QTLDDVFTYTATDAGELTSTTQITITVHGRNDNPVGVNDTVTAVEAGGYANATTGTPPTGNVLANDTDVDSNANGETKTVVGIFAGTQFSASGNVASAVTGTYGSINIAANGTYTYTVDNTNAAVQALRTTANTLSDVFTYTMVDAGGLTSSTQITVTIQGANDAPTAVVDTATAVEAGGLANGTAGTNPTGNVLTNDTDPDSAANGETKAVVGVLAGTVGSASTNVSSNVTGTYGSINIAANGAYTYTIDNSNSAVQSLRTSGNTLSDVFTYTMRDTAGLTTTTQITVTVKGGNDAPADVVAARYLSTLTPITQANVHGGATFDLGYQGVAMSLDGVTYSRGIGTVPPATGVGYIDYAIGGATTFKATLGINDYYSGNFGSVQFKVYVDNVLSYSSGTFTSLTAPVDISVNTTGGTTLRLEVNNADGSNNSDHSIWANARLEGGSVTLTVAENATNSTVVGSVNRSDADWGDNATYSLIDNAGGRFAIASNGQITVANSSLIDFESNPSPTIVVRVTDAGGLSFDKTMTINLTNVNEGPVAVLDTATAVEAGGVSNGTAGTNPTGNVLTNDTDVDAGDTKTVSGVAAGVVGSSSTNVGSAVVGTYGSINISSSGSYTYTVDNTNATVQALRTSAQTITDV